MRMLWIPQLSCVKDDEFHVACDSNWNFSSNVIAGLKDLYGDTLDINYLYPTAMVKSDKSDVLGFFNKYEILPIKYHFTTSVFGTRYDFNYDAFKSIIKQFNPDVIWENDPTHVRSLKTILYELKLNTKIVTYYHWIDGPLNPKVDKEISYWWRQLEAAFTADHLFFNSNYSANQFIDNVENTVNSYDDIRMIARKCAKIPPPFDMNLIVGTQKDKSNGIVFNHRLSSLPLYQENFNNLIKFVNRLYSENGAEPSIHFMNPRGLELPNFELFGCNEVYDKDLNTKEYYNYLKSSKVGIAPNFFFNSKNVWAIASVEAAALGNALILPNKFGYAEIAPKGYSGFCENEDEAYVKFKKCVMDENYRMQLVKEYRPFVDSVSIKTIAKEIYRLLNQN